MIKSLLIAFIGITIVVSQISSDIITKDTTNFGDITLIYEKVWYSGYLSIDTKTKAHYWYFPVQSTERDETDVPLVVVISQGPGCSTIGLNALNGIGPFVLDERDENLILNEYSWNFNANLLFIDPPGIGFSIGKVDTYTDSIFTSFYFDAIQIFLENWKDLKNVSLYLHGIGHAGLVVPKLALLMYNTKEGSSSTSIKTNISGFIVGNPVTSIAEVPELNAEFPYNRFEFLRTQGLLTWDLFYLFTSSCGYINTDFSKAKTDKCKAIVQEINLLFSGLNLQDITADCQYVYNEKLNPDYTCYDHTGAETYLNKDNWLKNLHVSGSFTGKYQVCSTINYTYTSDVISAYEELLQTGMRIWVFAGDTDAEIPFTGTLHWIDSLRDKLGLADLITYNSWFYQDVLASELAFVQNGGSYWKFDGMSFLRFKGCGQDAPRCNPIGSQLMFKNFINGDDMSQDFTNP